MNSILKAILLLICVVTALRAQVVGASMALEGRAAITRAAAYLLAHQRENGSWENSPALTSLSGQSLLAANSFLEDEGMALATARALSYVRTAPVDSDWREAVRLRLPLESEAQTDETALHEAAARLAKIAPPPEGVIWLADAMLQCASRLKTTVPAVNTANTPHTAAERLALAVITANHTDTSLKTLYSAARTINPFSATLSELFWAARSFQACNDAEAFPYDNWKADILSALLDRQRGNGAWQPSDQRAAQVIQDTSLAIQTIIICLN